MYSRRDYDRCINHTIFWLATSAAFLLAGAGLSLRGGISTRSTGLPLAGSLVGLGMVVRINRRDFEDSRTGGD